eukprot:scaffold13976_cov28-Tisochrysis_lutea.AAC.1
MGGRIITCQATGFTAQGYTQCGWAWQSVALQPSCTTVLQSSDGFIRASLSAEAGLASSAKQHCSAA